MYTHRKVVMENKVKKTSQIKKELLAQQMNPKNLEIDLWQVYSVVKKI